MVHGYCAWRNAIDSIDLCIILKLQAEDVAEFEKDFVTEGSEVYNAYKEGLIIYKFKVRSEVAKKAMTGDLKAIEQMKEFDIEDKMLSKQ